MRATGVALSAMGLAGEAWADELPATQSETITVTATRIEQEVFEVPGTVSVITAEDVEAILASDIKELVRFEPGVSVRNSPSRFTAALASTGRDGNSGFNVRGLEGDRVLLMVDGVRVPDGFSFGPAAFGRGDYVDLDLLQRVEILRGPGSSLYGSDGVAGVVSFTTRDPDTYLDPGDSFGGRARVLHASADDSWNEGVSVAGRWGHWSALAVYSRRDGHEQETQGENDSASTLRTAANPQGVEANAAMLRVVFQPSDIHRFRFTADYGDREVSTEALSARSAAVLDLDGRDESDRTRFAFDYYHKNEGGFIDRGFASIYYQIASALQFSAEDRDPAADRTRLTTFDNDVLGFAAQLQSEFNAGGVRHLLTYGGDYSVTTQEGLRDGTVPPVGESFPTRPFPTTDYALAGLFIQDQISFMDGRVVFYPSIRYDLYELDPATDAFYALPIAGQDDGRVTSRFGVVAWPTENVGVFFNYAEGFKAPAPSQVNNNFANPIIGYTSIPNPDLKAETSEALELGVRFRHIDAIGAEWRASGAAFMADYDDFIEQVQVSGAFTPLDPAVFQYVNLTAVQIWGLEGRVNGAWENGFGLDLSASFAEGDQIDGAGVRTPLHSIDPFRVIAGLRFDDPEGRFGGQFIVTYVGAKEDDRVAENRDGAAANDLFTPDSFAILDITGYWNMSERVVFRAGVFNVANEEYWWWGDVRGNATSSPIMDAFTQPGTNFSAAIAYRF